MSDPSAESVVTLRELLDDSAETPLNWHPDGGRTDEWAQRLVLARAVHRGFLQDPLRLAAAHQGFQLGPLGLGFLGICEILPGEFFIEGFDNA